MDSLLRLHFLKPGLYTTVQDQGRPGFQEFGVPLSGALDRRSAHLANSLVDNPTDSPVLEITLMGPKIEFEGQGQIALTGGDLGATLNGVACPRYQTIRARTGDILQFGRAHQGCRAYLAVGGQWQLPTWLSSYSAITQNGAQLTPQAIIKKEQIIAIIPKPLSSARSLVEKIPQYLAEPTIRVFPGPEFERFSRFCIGTFFSQLFTISPAANRMGYRLKEQLDTFQPQEELISSGIIPGTIQITSAGQPIILLADAQTSGGYYRLANVIEIDMDTIAQLKPGDRLRFSLLSFEEAEHLG